MSSFISTATPLVFVAETWVVSVVSIAIIGCFIFLLFLLIISTRSKHAIPKPDTNVRRKIFYAEPKISDKSSSTKVTTTDISNASLVPVTPVVMVTPLLRPLPPPVRKVYVSRPAPVANPITYFPGRMFVNKMPRRYYPYRPVV